MGIETRFVDPSDPDTFVRATDDGTRAWYVETLPNPKLVVAPLAAIAALGRPLGIPLIVDNTAAPLLARPFDHGATIVVYSTTKYIGGHGTSIGGMIVDGGNFDWSALPERQSLLNTPDASYHGAIWIEAAHPLGPIVYALRARLAPAVAVHADRNGDRDRDDPPSLPVLSLGMRNSTVPARVSRSR